MSDARYKMLMTNLPAMAAVVNTFQSAEVQLAVYQELITALENRVSVRAPEAGRAKAASRMETPRNGDLVHDLIDGESIHEMNGLL